MEIETPVEPQPRLETVGEDEEGVGRVSPSYGPCFDTAKTVYIYIPYRTAVDTKMYIVGIIAEKHKNVVVAENISVIYHLTIY